MKFLYHVLIEITEPELTQSANERYAGDIIDAVGDSLRGCEIDLHDAAEGNFDHIVGVEVTVNLAEERW